MPDIVLTTLNARYAHAAFGLRYLFANLGDLQARAQIIEFDINQRPLDMAETILAAQPRIVGIGVYIWNVTPSTQLVAALKRLRPDLVVVLGGPEVSYETDQQPIAHLADYVITGEADLAFADLCRSLLMQRHPPLAPPKRGIGVRSPSSEGLAVGAVSSKIIPAPLPDFSQLALPYAFYTDEDIAHRVVYVEASRGCPFACEFCLSSLEIPVRNVPLEAFLGAMQQLFDRGVRQFKFVDRTFNLNLATGRAILTFFRERYTPGLFLHFEMIPDRLPAALQELIRQFPPRALQFEVGIQTFNEEVATRISRRQDNARAETNLRWLREQTGVHVHADLIVGLPGESVASFGAGFDRLVALHPHEIQVGLLKRLRGTPIIRHDQAWEMIYSPDLPYEILQNKLIDFPTLQRLRRFARYWDLVANSGRFGETLPLIWGPHSAFASFLGFSDWLYAHVGRTHAIALPRLTELLGDYLREQGVPNDNVAVALASDAARHRPDRRPSGPAAPKRQARHLAKTVSPT